MKSTKSKQSSITQTTTRKINNLVKKALKDCFKIEPAEGNMYLKDLEKGSIFNTNTMKGIYLESTPTSAKVIIVSCNADEEDKSYYLGKQNIANETEVKIENDYKKKST